MATTALATAVAIVGALEAMDAETTQKSQLEVPLMLPGDKHRLEANLIVLLNYPTNSRGRNSGWPTPKQHSNEQDAFRDTTMTSKSNPEL